MSPKSSELLLGASRKLTFLEDEKAASAGAFVGMFGLPLLTYMLYNAMEPTGDLDPPGKLCYVIMRIAPTILMQWFVYEFMATYRAAMTKQGKCPAPWEAQDRAAIGQPTPTGIDAMNPPFHALWFRACQNNLESTTINTFAIMCFGLWCGDGVAMYDARLAVAFGYMHAIGGLIYQVAYSYFGPNHRMYGFILRGWWNNAGLALFCLLRSFGVSEHQGQISLLWQCLVGILVGNVVVLGIATKTIKAGVSAPFGYSKAEYEAWGVKVQDEWFKVKAK